LTDDFKKEYEAKLKEAEDKYLRVHADFENIKKRLEREKYQAIEYASENFAKDLLAPIDSLEMAIASIKADGDTEELLKKMQEGLELTIRNFKTVFEKHGIELVEIDSGFDPNFHDAVMQVASEKHEDGEIVQLLQNGYKYKDRLLRPAMVSVCKK
jgi:molecular chaperone GrpE